MNSHAVYVGRLLFSLGLLGLGTSAWAQMAVEYYHLDAAGSVLAITDESGALVEEHDYDVFGQEVGAQAGTQPRRFAGKERDTETGWDYFGARYYGSKVGRFTTVDPVYTWKENLVDPQRWNRYTYAKNNPLRYIDPDGRETTVITVINRVGRIPGSDRAAGIVFHTALRADNNGDPYLYDPSGGYLNRRRPGDALFQGADADLDRYIQDRIDVGEVVETTTIKTTAEQEAMILKQAQAQGDPWLLGLFPFACATSVSEAVQGVGPFKTVERTMFPARLRRQVNALPGSRTTTHDGVPAPAREGGSRKDEDRGQ